MLKIPDELHARGRGDDPHFAPGKQLYRRFHPAALHRGKLAIDAIELPDISVNRQKYSKPQWALLFEGCEHWGVASILVVQIPGELPVPARNLRFTFDVVHAPLRLNFAHSEVRAYRNGVHLGRQSISELDPEVHLRFRHKLRQVMRVCVQPSQSP